MSEQFRRESLATTEPALAMARHSLFNLKGPHIVREIAALIYQGSIPNTTPFAGREIQLRMKPAQRQRPYQIVDHRLRDGRDYS